jgi:hypothetical protein
MAPDARRSPAALTQCVGAQHFFALAHFLKATPAQQHCCDNGVSNMMMSAVIAVALGIVPVTDNGPPQLVRFDQSEIARQIGRYSLSLRKDGKTRVSGFDRLGRAYDLTLDASGHVDGSVGDMIVTFDVADAA